MDRRIIGIFQSHGYQSNKALAATLRVSERTVRRHVNQMIADAVLNIVIIPDPVAYGMKAWTKIGVKAEPALIHSVAEKLVRHPSVYFVANSLGRFDIIIAARFESVGNLEHFVNSELASSEGVTGSETWMLVTPRRYYSFSWPAPVAVGHDALHGDADPGRNENRIASAVDHGIVSMLWEDGRSWIPAISYKLGISESTVRRRMHYLLVEGLCKREVVLSTSRIENETWATIGICTRSRNVHDVIDELLKYPAVYLASSSLGKFNIVLSTRFRSMDLLNRFVMVDLPSIAGITSTETFVHNRPLKYHNIAMSRLE